MTDSDKNKIINLDSDDEEVDKKEERIFNKLGKLTKKSLSRMIFGDEDNNIDKKRDKLDKINDEDDNDDTPPQNQLPQIQPLFIQNYQPSSSSSVDEIRKIVVSPYLSIEGIPTLGDKYKRKTPNMTHFFHTNPQITFYRKIYRKFTASSQYTCCIHAPYELKEIDSLTSRYYLTQREDCLGKIYLLFNEAIILGNYLKNIDIWVGNYKIDTWDLNQQYWEKKEHFPSKSEIWQVDFSVNSSVSTYLLLLSLGDTPVYLQFNWKNNEKIPEFQLLIYLHLLDEEEKKRLQMSNTETLIQQSVVEKHQLDATLTWASQNNAYSLEVNNLLGESLGQKVGWVTLDVSDITLPVDCFFYFLEDSQENKIPIKSTYLEYTANTKWIEKVKAIKIDENKCKLDDGRIYTHSKNDLTPMPNMSYSNNLPLNDPLEDVNIGEEVELKIERNHLVYYFLPSQITHKFTYAQDMRDYPRKLQDNVHYLSFAINDPKDYQPSGSAYFFLGKKKSPISGDPKYLAKLHIQIDPNYKLTEKQVTLRVKWCVRNIFKTCNGERDINHRNISNFRNNIGNDTENKEFVFLVGEFRGRM